MPSDALQLSIVAHKSFAHAAFMHRHLLAAHRLLRSPLKELSIALVNSPKMSSLHRQFMQIDGPTDVLTFPLELDRRGRVIAGEIVICVPVAHHQAKDRGVSIQNELLLYAIHGMLHLLGWDDRTPRESKLMHDKEDQILSKLGVGRVFAPSELGARPLKRARRNSAGGR